MIIESVEVPLKVGCIKSSLSRSTSTIGEKLQMFYLFDVVLITVFSSIIVPTNLSKKMYNYRSPFTFLCDLIN